MYDADCTTALRVRANGGRIGAGAGSVLECYWPRVVLHVRTGALSAAGQNRIRTRLPEVEFVSSDEFFVDLTHEPLWAGSPLARANRLRAVVRRAAGDTSCTVGISASRSAARFASTCCEPGEICEISPWDARARLRTAPLDLIYGAAGNLGRYLNRRGIRTCGAVADLSGAELARRFGSAGEQLWLACQGRDGPDTAPDRMPAEAVGVRQVLPPRTDSVRAVEAHLRHLSGRLATRLRRLELQAGQLSIALQFVSPGTGAESVVALPPGPPDRRRLFETARRFFLGNWRGESVAVLRLEATRLSNASGQLELFV